MDRGAKNPRARAPTRGTRGSKSSGRGGSGGGGGKDGAGRGGGGRGGGGSSAKMVVVPTSKHTTVEELAALASNSSLATVRRLPAMQQLKKALTTPTGRKYALRDFETMLQAVLRVLLDVEPSLSAAAEEAVAAWLGELSTSPINPAPTPAAAVPGLDVGSRILDEILPILSSGKIPVDSIFHHGGTTTTKSTTAVALSPGQVKALLTVTKECLSKVSGFTAFRRAGAVFAEVKKVLENEATHPDVVGKALETMQEAMKAFHLQSEMASSVAETLIQWARRGELSAPTRALLSRAMHSVSAAWESSEEKMRNRQKTTAELVAEICDACCSFGGDSTTTNTTKTVGMVLSLIACVVPLLVRGIHKKEVSATTHVLSLLKAFARVVVAVVAVRHQNGGGDSTGDSGTKKERLYYYLPPSAVQELCSQANLFATTLLKNPTTTTAAAAVGTTSTPAFGAAVSLLKPPPPSSDDDRLVTIEFLLHTNDENEGEDDISTVVTLKIVHAPSQHTIAPSAPAELTTISSLSSSVAAVLTAAIHLLHAALERDDVCGRHAAVSSITNDLLHWQALLPGRDDDNSSVPLPENVKAALLQMCLPPTGPLSKLRTLVSATVVQPVARLYVHVIATEKKVLRSVLDEILAACVGDGNDDDDNDGEDLLSSKEQQQQLQFNVNVLLAVVKGDSRIRGSSNDENEFFDPIWTVLLEILGSFQPSTSPKILSLAPKLIQTAQIAFEKLPSANEHRAVAALNLTCHIVQVCPKLKEQTLNWQIELLPLVMVIYIVSGSDGAQEAAVHRVLLCATETTEDRTEMSSAVRAAAFAVVKTFLSCWSSDEFDFVVLDGNAAVLRRICDAALTATTTIAGGDDDDENENEKEVEQARHVLEACALPLSLLALDGNRLTHPIENGTIALEVALQPRQMAFSTSQLSLILNYITGTGTSPTDLATTTPAQSNKDWLQQIVQDMEILTLTSSSDPEAPPPTMSLHSVIDKDDSLPQLWWFALQTAAKQCIHSKLTTHWGSAAQTLGTLERAVQKLLTLKDNNCNSTFTSKEAPAGVRKQKMAGNCLLHFLFALEQEMAVALSGAVARSAPSKHASLYFSGNKRVCEEWFARLRLTAAAAATDLGLFHLTVYHASKRLTDLHLKRRKSAAIAAAKAAAVEQQPSDASEKTMKSSTTTTTAKSTTIEKKTPFVSGEETKGMLLLRRPVQSNTTTSGPSPGAALLTQAHLQQQQPQQQHQILSSGRTFSSTSGADTSKNTTTAVDGGSSSNNGGVHSLFTVAGNSNNSSSSIINEQAFEKSVTEAAVMLASVLHALHDADGITGVHQYCKKMTEHSLSSPSSPSSSSSSSSWEWLAAAELSAAGNYEGALRVLENNNNKGINPFTAVMQAEAYAAVQNFEGLGKWIKELNVTSSSPPSSISTTSVLPDADLFSQLSSWGGAHDSIDTTPTPPTYPNVNLRVPLLSASPLHETVKTLTVASTTSKRFSQRKVLEKASMGLVDRIASRASICECAVQGTSIFSTSSAYDSSSIIEEFGALAALQLALKHTVAAENNTTPPHIPLLSNWRSLLARSLSPVPELVFSAWKNINSGSSGGDPVAVSIASCLLLGTLSLSSTSSSSAAVAHESVSSNDTSLAALKVSAARAVHACGNVNWASRLLSSSIEQEEGKCVVDSDVVASALLQKLIILKSGGDSDDDVEHVKAAAVAALRRLQSGEGEPSMLRNGLRVGLMAALHPPEEEEEEEEKLSSFLGMLSDTGGPLDASLWWQYGQYMYHKMQNSDDVSVSSAQRQQQESDGREALRAFCKVATLAATSTGGGDVTSGILPVMLIIQRLVAEHGDQLLSTETESATATIPSSAWHPIIPQLVSLLATSPSAAIQNFAALALQSAALQEPSLVLLPALAELHRHDSSGPSSPPALQSFIQKMRGTHSLLCDELTKFIDAMSHLALLEDEQWHAVLQEAHGTLAKRLAATYAYLKTLREPTDAFTPAFLATAGEEFECAVMPVLCALRCHVAAVEAAPPSTPYEEEFRQKTNLVAKLRWLVEQLAQPLALNLRPASESISASAKPIGVPSGTLETALQRPLQSIKKVASEIVQGLKSSSLSLERVCPALLTILENSTMPIPGESSTTTSSSSSSSSSGGTVPRIASFSTEAKVLHTKTRPKKIEMVGTDGKVYAFLVKGREDLRVDLTVSNFLSAAAAAAAAAAAPPSSSLSSRNGTMISPLVVIPVAAKAGLVGWVENTVPLYEVFSTYETQQAQRSAWLAAAAAAHAQAKPPILPPSSSSASSSMISKSNKRGTTGGGGETATQRKKAKKAAKEKARQEAEAAAAAAKDQAAQSAAATEQAMRPADKFRAKLKALGVNTSSSRSSWPLNALRAVHLDLAAAAPRSMISSELLSGAAGAAHWWSRQNHYSSSTAAMSVLGYLLGLGDRHLDNILFESLTGAVLHVDFGVLFDRGQKLAVPELVPFRLTQSFVAGLGATGVEGRFKRGAEGIYKAVQQNEHVMTLLLQTALEDELIAWAPETEVRSSRVAFERCAELAHFMHSMKTSEISNEHVTAAAAGAGAALAQLNSVLAPFQKIFTSANAASTALSHHQGVIEQYKAVLEETSEEETDVLAAITEGNKAIQSLSLELSTAVQEAALLESDCAAWQTRYSTVLSAAADGLLAAALSAAAPQWDPAAAEIPLALVQAYDSPTGMTVLSVAVGLQPSNAPLTASLLLKAATVDDAGSTALRKRAAAVRTALALVQKYGTAIASLDNGDNSYKLQSHHAQWLPALQAAVHGEEPVVPFINTDDDGGSSSAEIVKAISTWHVLKVQSITSSSLLRMLQETQSVLQSERTDVALAAADAKTQTAAAVAESQLNEISIALAAFTVAQAHQAEALMAADPGAEVLDGLQQLVLGYTTVVITARDAATDAAAVGGGDGSDINVASLFESVTSWLTGAVQAADSIGSLAGELQALVPKCAALLSTETEVSSVTEIVDAVEELLDSVCDGHNEEESDDDDDDEINFAGGASIDSTAPKIMSHLLNLSNRWPVLASLLQCLQSVHTAATSMQPSSPLMQRPPQSGKNEKVAGPMLKKLFVYRRGVGASEGVDAALWEMLQLGAVAVDMWHSMSIAWNPIRFEIPDSILSSTSTSRVDEAQVDEGWRRLSHIVAAAVSSAVQLQLLPTVAAAMNTAAANLESAGSSPGIDIITTGGGVTTASQQEDDEDEEEDHRQEDDDEEFEIVNSQLPSFFDYSESENDASLETPGIRTEEESDVIDDLLQPLEQLGIIDESNDDNDGIDSSILRLTEILTYCADTAGALAAVDAVLHVTVTTAHLAAQQTQQATADLAAHQWRTEPLLLTVLHTQDLSLASSMSSSTINSTMALPGVFSDISASSSSSSAAVLLGRHTLLSHLRHVRASIDAAEGEIESWRVIAVPIRHQLAEELFRIAPHAARNIAACLDAAQEWNGTAASHVAAVRDAVQAVLDFEDSRETLLLHQSHSHSRRKKHINDDEEEVDKEESVDSCTENVVQVESLRYKKSVLRVHAARAAVTSTESALVQNQQRLLTLQHSRTEATEAIQSAEKSEVEALSQLSRFAMPLVKATQKLTKSLKDVDDAFTDMAPNTEVLLRAHRRLARLQSAPASSGGGGGTAGISSQGQENEVSEATQALSRVLGTLRSISEAIKKLLAAVAVAQRGLLQGGRGEAAAREQAKDVVRVLHDPMEALKPLIDATTVLQDIAALGKVPALLVSIISTAAAELADLCHKHALDSSGFSLSNTTTTTTTDAMEWNRCLSSPHLYPPPSISSPASEGEAHVQREQRRAFASGILSTFRNKLSCCQTLQEESSEVDGDGAAPAGVAVSVSEHVDALIGQATDVNKLAKMYEGWMPWV